MKMFLVCLALLATIVSGNLDCKLYDELYRQVDALISENPEYIPPFVRLAFHDCVGKACDGCLNIRDPDNSGLSDIIDVLDGIYDEKYSHDLSRSDFWQLASHVALVRGGLNRPCDHEHCHFFDLQYLYGRKDCHSSPKYFGDDDAGNPHGDYSEVWRIMHGYFGLTHEEIITIFGAHSLGGAHDVKSGFKYNWQENHLVFDNSYFKNLVSLPYTHEDVSLEEEEGAAPTNPAEAEAVEAAAFNGEEKPSRYQFARIPTADGEDDLLMLNTDISLWKHVEAIKTKGGHFTGRLTCMTRHGRLLLPEGEASRVDECKDTYTTKLVYEYAHNLVFFYKEFPKAWYKMVSNGHKDLKVPGYAHQKCGFCIPEEAFCVEGFEKAGECCPGYQCQENKCVKNNYYY